MAIRALASLSLHQSRIRFHSYSSLNNTIRRGATHREIVCKVINDEPVLGQRRGIQSSGRCVGVSDVASEPTNGSGAKVKTKRPKGRRAVVKWLKSLRHRKKKEYARMSAEEKVLYKLTRAQKKEEKLAEALERIEPKAGSETTHDPEILTPEEHFFFLRMGMKSRNYVPVGRRGIYGGVILNMHLHWKKHQTLQVIIKTFNAEEVKDIAKELARLTGGIVLHIHKEDTIIMYRGKNYSQPPTEIMWPRETLSRMRALDKSKYRDGLRSVRKYIPKLELDLQLLQARERNDPADISAVVEEEQEETEEAELESEDDEAYSLRHNKNSDEAKVKAYESDQLSESNNEDGLTSDSEGLTDMFETDSELGSDENARRPLYMEQFDKLSVKSDGELEDFEDHLRRVSADSKKDVSLSKEGLAHNYDDIDRLFLRAATLFKKTSGR